MLSIQANTFILSIQNDLFNMFIRWHFISRARDEKFIINLKHVIFKHTESERI